MKPKKLTIVIVASVLAAALLIPCMILLAQTTSGPALFTAPKEEKHGEEPQLGTEYISWTFAGKEFVSYVDAGIDAAELAEKIQSLNMPGPVPADSIKNTLLHEHDWILSLEPYLTEEEFVYSLRVMNETIGFYKKFSFYERPYDMYTDDEKNQIKGVEDGEWICDPDEDTQRSVCESGLHYFSVWYDNENPTFHYHVCVSRFCSFAESAHHTDSNGNVIDTRNEECAVCVLPY